MSRVVSLAYDERRIFGGYRLNARNHRNQQPFTSTRWNRCDQSQTAQEQGA